MKDLEMINNCSRCALNEILSFAFASFSEAAAAVKKTALNVRRFYGLQLFGVKISLAGVEFFQLPGK